MADGEAALLEGGTLTIPGSFADGCREHHFTLVPQG